MRHIRTILPALVTIVAVAPAQEQIDPAAVTERIVGLLADAKAVEDLRSS